MAVHHYSANTCLLSIFKLVIETYIRLQFLWKVCGGYITPMMVSCALIIVLLIVLLYAAAPNARAAIRGLAPWAVLVAGGIAVGYYSVRPAVVGGDERPVHIDGVDRPGTGNLEGTVDTFENITDFIVTT